MNTLKAEYIKPEMEVEEYTPVDVLTGSTDTSGDLHNTDDYEYGGKN